MLHEIQVLAPEEIRLIEGDAMCAILAAHPEGLTVRTDSAADSAVDSASSENQQKEQPVTKTGRVQSNTESQSQICKAMFFDIETTGLSPDTAFVFLIGCIYHDGRHWSLHQFLIRTVQEESVMLSSFFELAVQAEVLVHFNGNRFDLPFLEKRAEANHLASFASLSPEIRSIDLYRHFAPLKKRLSLSRMNQDSLEKQAGWERKDHLTGKDVVKLFWNFTASKDETTKQLLLGHNRDDLLGMLQISRLEAYLPLFGGNIFCGDIFEGDIFDENINPNFSVVKPENLEHQKNQSQAYSNNSVKEPDSHSRLRIPFTCPLPLPAPLQIEMKLTDDSESSISLTVKEQEGLLLLPVFEGTLRYFFQDYKNYYYLPLEDQAIHKSVAFYVDKKHRIPAKPDTCYITRTGRFLPLRVSPGTLHISLRQT
ncbi:MAG: ribonuclease H-like domain-containing protein, partial [Lachnospiraceae bacterium]|nr:ribonuclease H-like domain-containing protein [Lachnospiraceae bacterium]